MDPTYTGKAFAGMIRYLADQKIRGENILFLHTGGLPLFFDHLAGMQR
jgi:D-cysteine desulfhydrase